MPVFCEMENREIKHIYNNLNQNDSGWIKTIAKHHTLYDFYQPFAQTLFNMV